MLKRTLPVFSMSRVAPFASSRLKMRVLPIICAQYSNADFSFWSVKRSMRLYMASVDSNDDRISSTLFLSSFWIAVLKARFNSRKGKTIRVRILNL